MTSPYDLRKIRTLLTEGFSDEELRSLCFDLPEFKSVYHQLAQNTGKTEIVARLLEYTERTVQFDRLLELAKTYNPAQYAGHEPYFYDDSAAASPYPGMHYFDVRDADRFFGRELLTAKLVGRLTPSPALPLSGGGREGGGRFLAVVGASGSGKSSVVRAGLVPALLGGQPLADGSLPPEGCTQWPIHIITPTAHPLETLAASLTRDSESVTATTTLMDDLSKDARSLHLYVRKLMSRGAGERRSRGEISSPPLPPISPAPRHLLLVVDQFEELFTLCRQEAERKAFVDNLLTAVGTPSPSEGEGWGGGDGPTLVILTLRADFYAHCAQYENLREALARWQEYIGPMSAEELRRAIELPAQRAGYEFEPGLVNLILRDVGDEPGALPLLSHALLETWRRREGRVLTLAGYADSGGVRGAIAQTAERVFNNLPSEQQVIARRIFLRLTELGEGTQDMRRRTGRADLVPQPEEQGPAEAVLQTLVEARLVTTDQDTVEVAHEALIREWPTLRHWLDEDREGLRLHRQLSEAAQEWENLQRDAGALYRGARLAQAGEWAGQHPAELNTVEQQFLAASKQAEEDEQERELAQARALAEERQRRVRWVAVAGVAALVLAIVAVVFGIQANQNAAIAFSRQLAAQSLSQLAGWPDLALLLSVEANSITDTTTVEARNSLLTGLQDRPELLTFLRGHTSTVWSVAFSPDEQTLAAGSGDGSVILWDVSQPGSPVQLGQPLTGHTDAVRSVAFSPPDEQTLAAGSGDGSVILWDVSQPGSPVRLGQPLTGHTSDVYSVAFSPNGRTLATGSGDRSVILWDVSQPGSPVRLGQPLTGHLDAVLSVAFSPNGQTLATGSEDGSVILWDVGQPGTAVRLGEPLTGHKGAVLSVAFSPPDGQTLATGSGDGSVILWDVSRPGSPVQLGQALTGHTDAVSSVAFSPNGQTLAAGSWDGSVILWDVRQPGAPAQLGQALTGHTSWWVHSVAFSRDGQTLAAGSGDGSVILWDVRQPGAPAWLGQPLTGHLDAVWSVAFSPDEQTLAAGSGDGSVILWDVGQPGEPVQLGQPLTGHTGGVSSVAFSPDGQTLATGSGDKSVILWDVSQPGVPERLGQPLTGHTGTVYSVAFSPDGKTLAAGGGGDGSVILWDVSQPGPPVQLGQPLTGHTRAVMSMAFSPPEGQTLATGSGDESVILWDVSQPGVPERLGQPLTGHTGTVSSVAFSPNGQTLATGSLDGSVILWDVSQPGSPVWLDQPLSHLTGHWFSVESVAFSPDGQTLATGSWSGSVILWDVRQPESPVRLGQPLTGHTGTVSSVAFSPDGQTLATGSLDKSVILWDINVESWKAKACRKANWNMTETEWQRFMGERPYRETCPGLP